MARKEKARLAVTPRHQRFREQRVSPLAGILRDEFSFILIFLLTFVPPFLPIGTALRSLSSETRAVRFLETAWQVQGAALGLSLAVVLFVFQSVYVPASAARFASSRWIPTMEEDRYAIRLLRVDVSTRRRRIDRQRRSRRYR